MSRAVPNTFAATMAALALLALPWSARAAISDFRGHLSVGYAKLFATGAPGGSLSLEGGVDYPIDPSWRTGLGVGYDLLGTRNAAHGSFVANVDYSLVHIDAQVHWQPPSHDYIARVSFGPSVFNAHADVSSSGAGAAFSDLAVSQTCGGASLDVTLMKQSDAPVRVGLEMGARIAFVTGDTWTMDVLRIVFHY
jgi:hypothetical protein